MKIQNDRVVQQDLRSTFETQSAIEQLKGQCQTELEELQEKIAVHRFQMQAYKISSPPQNLPGGDTDKRGEELKKLMRVVNDAISDRFDDRERVLIKSQESVRRQEKLISEKTALRDHDVQSIRSKQQRMAELKPSFERTRQVVEELLSFEARDDEVTSPVGITAERPDDLLSYLTKRMESIEGQSTEGIPPQMIKKIMKKLFKLVRTKTSSYWHYHLLLSCHRNTFLLKRFISLFF